jgi:hypothetical protein
MFVEWAVSALRVRSRREIRRDPALIVHSTPGDAGVMEHDDDPAARSLTADQLIAAMPD